MKLFYSNPTIIVLRLSEDEFIKTSGERYCMDVFNDDWRENDE